MANRKDLLKRHKELTAELEAIESALSTSPDPQQEVEVVTVQARKENFNTIDVWFTYPDKEDSGEFMVIGKFKAVSEIWQPIADFVQQNFDQQKQYQIIVNLLDNTNGSKEL